MAKIFFTCLQCGEYLKADHQTVASEVRSHMCMNEFDKQKFQKGITMLEDELKIASVPQPPPVPPAMPSVASYIVKNETVAFSGRIKGKTN